MKIYITAAVVGSMLMLSAWNVIAEEGPLSHVERGIIVAKDGQQLKFEALTRDGDQIKYTNVESKSEETMAVSDVLKVREEVGDEGKETAIKIGAIGALGAAVGVSSTNTNGVEVSSGTKSAIILGLATLSAAVGYFTGKSLKKYEDVYVNDQYTSRRTPDTRLMLTGDGVGLQVEYKF